MPIQIRKGAGALRRKHVWLALLVAGLVLLVMSGCSQAKQAGTRSVSTAADLIAQMADQEVSTSDSPLESGTAAAATHLLKNRSTVVTGEENGLLAQALREGDLLCDGTVPRQADFFVTDEPENFTGVAELFLGHSVNGHTSRINIETY